MNLSHRTLALGAACVLSALAVPAADAAAGSIGITAGYDYASPTYVANTFFTVSNAAGATLSNIVFTSVGDGSVSSADSATWSSWSALTLATGSSLTLYFPGTGTGTDSGVSGTGYGFTADYEYTLAGNDQTYTFSALVAGQTVTTTFSPTSNTSGAFVAFLGNDAAGNSLPANVSASVATVAVGAVPEPAAGALWAAGLLSIGVFLRRPGHRAAAPALR